MTAFWRLAICMAVVLTLSGSAHAETVEEVQKKLNDAYAKLQSYSATSETTQDMSMSGIKIDGKQEGRIRQMRKGDKILSRVEQKGQVTRKFDDEVQTARIASETVCDGDYSYTIIENSGTGNEAGTKTVTKQKVDPATLNDVLSIVNAQKISYTLRLRPDEEVDGAECYVIEAAPPKEEGELPYTVITMWFRKTDAIMAKMVGTNEDEKEVHSYVLSDIKTNEDMSEDLFKFTPPPGVAVTDLTGDTKPEAGK